MLHPLMHTNPVEPVRLVLVPVTATIMHACMHACVTGWVLEYNLLRLAQLLSHISVSSALSAVQM